MIWLMVIVFLAFVGYALVVIPRYDLNNKAHLGKLIRLGGVCILILYALHLLSKYFD